MVVEDVKNNDDDFLSDAVIISSENEENLNNFFDKLITSGIQSYSIQILESIQNEVNRRNKELITLQLRQQTRIARQQELLIEINKEEENLKHSQVQVKELVSVGRNPEAELISQSIQGLTTFV